MSTDSPTSFRLPADVSKGIEECAEDRDISQHKAGVRSMEQGLEAMGYGHFGERTWVAALAAESAKAMIYLGMGMLILAPIAPPVVQVATIACFAGAVVALLVERAEPAVTETYNLGDVPPWERGREDDREAAGAD